MSGPLTSLPQPGVVNLGDQAYQQIKQLIFDFVLLPSDRFSEGELATRLQISRTPLRQALQRLQREGFVQVFPKSGWQVAPLDFDALDQLYDLRILLELHAVALLCDMPERPILHELAQVWILPDGAAPLSAEEVGPLDEAFHAALMRATGNQEMARVHEDISDRIRIVRRLDFTKAARVSTTYEEHARILRAILQRRVDEGQRLLRAHIEQSKLEVRHITLDVLYRARSETGRRA